MFPYYRQLDTKDCGSTCLKIVAKYYGKTISLNQLRELSETTRSGINLQFLATAAESINLRSLPAKIDFQQLKEAPLPCVLHWNKDHFVVLYKIKNDGCYISDPALGLVKYNKEAFINYWIGENANDKTEEGVVLLLGPTIDFHKTTSDQKQEPLNLNFIFKYLVKYKSFLMQLVFGLLAGSLLQFIFPFLTQGIVDVGI